MTSHLLSLFLRAVALVESGNDPRAVGAAGERGRFQMTPAVVATCGGFGEREAARWERQLERELLAAGIAPLPFNVALAWNAGPNAVRRGAVPLASYDYARRVCSTMDKLKTAPLPTAIGPGFVPSSAPAALPRFALAAPIGANTGKK